MPGQSLFAAANVAVRLEFIASRESLDTRHGGQALRRLQLITGPLNLLAWDGVSMVGTDRRAVRLFGPVAPYQITAALDAGAELDAAWVSPWA